MLKTCFLIHSKFQILHLTLYKSVQMYYNSAKRLGSHIDRLFLKFLYFKNNVYDLFNVLLDSDC